MADISASMVMELRQRTGLGMMECKKVLAEAAGDLAKAEELLRIKSGAKASKAAAASRRKASSARISPPTARPAAMVEVNCETDFVSRNEDFVAFAKVARAARRGTEPGRRRRALRLAARRRHGRERPPGAGAEDRREHVDPPVRALRHARRGSSSTCTAAGASASPSRSTAATSRRARTSRCTSRRPPRRARCVRCA